MISLPRSPVAKLVIGLLVIFCLIAYNLQYQSSYNRESWNTPGGSYQDQDQYKVGGSKERRPVRSFKVPKNLHLTHDIAIPYDIPPWTQEDTDLLDTTMGFHLKTELLKNEYAKTENVANNPGKINFAELSKAERVYKSLWNHIYPIYQGLSGRDRDRESTLYEMAKTRPEIDFFMRLEKRLFPWLHYGRRTSFSLVRSYKGRGLVFCAGNGQFEFVVTAIQAIRIRIKSSLPIQVYHMGENDLSNERQKYLRDMASDIEVIDVTQTLDNDYMQLGGWAIKPFAMLASSFEEVMFVDADAYFLQDPAVLFEDPGYMATGALFFYDRTLFGGIRTGSDWLRSVSPLLSSFPPTSRMFRMVSAHEQESGVVLINKRTRLLGMLATCKMNSKWERELVSYKVFHGDKETFWTGFEMIQEPYAFMRNYGGVIGELRPDNDKSVCGAQLHEDHQGRPLWWNGGLYRNKNSRVYRYLQFDYWMTGGGHQKHRERLTNDPDGMKDVLRDLGLTSPSQLKQEPKDAEWDFGESCLAGAKVNQLTQLEKNLANGYVGIDKIARIDGEKMNQGEKVNPRMHDWNAV
ncbi:hypothetical protein BG011_007120 [Mortierella polycephala]|uniref:Glycosyltransferase family 71 protein n=1 Tax=Mortierella polycephala TaxID=41804 RepID=A0A9P6TZ41_9FUNG|nr:hypothetical protein BG011_007120 [Mortierella polycephala]